MSVKDDLLSDFPHVYPGLTRPQVERLLTLLDESASTGGGLGLSVATAIKPLAPDIAARIESYNKADVDDYVRILRGAAVLLLQRWQPENQPPSPESVAAAVETIEADA
ncbi:hypothetical protein [Mycobacterium sp. IS-3022]|uniref:hypothetical protein n=1 Tax=Mycobacterium sp. IS-3022 TaxID=1772277 RepID=UPI0007415FF0|nr:hypothetical protein [Mycobacterium sp. IS-3022]KUI05925.1 hypothetical protein AU188_02220 [Mycobacterium sp. IS-3022]